MKKSPLKSRTKPRKLPKPTISKLKKEADRVFSLWVRARDKNICFTCGNPGNQAGHFRSRRFNSTRYDPINVHCQDTRCNIFEHGNLYVYALNLDKTYGAGCAEALYKISQVEHKLTVQELQEIIDKYS